MDFTFCPVETELAGWGGIHPLHQESVSCCLYCCRACPPIYVLDLQTAIEIYTPLFALFLPDRDFWRSSNSLQLDETIALYVGAAIARAERRSEIVRRPAPTNDAASQTWDPKNVPVCERHPATLSGQPSQPR